MSIAIADLSLETLAQAADAASGAQPKKGSLEDYFQRDGQKLAHNLRLLAGRDAADTARDIFHSDTCSTYAQTEFKDSWRSLNAAQEKDFRDKTIAYIETVKDPQKREEILKATQSIFTTTKTGESAHDALANYFASSDALAKLKNTPENAEARMQATRVMNDSINGYADVVDKILTDDYRQGRYPTAQDKAECQQKAPAPKPSAHR